MWVFFKSILFHSQITQPITSYVIPFSRGETIGTYRLTSLAVSPNGAIVYSMYNGVQRQLYLKLRDQLKATPIPSTEGGISPFFSPDGQWIGFQVGAMLKKVHINAGIPEDICGGGNIRGACWGEDNTIIYTPSWSKGLQQISVDGGEPSIVSTPDLNKRERSHRFPDILPGGQTVLFTIASLDITSFDEAQIALLDVKTGQITTIIENGS